MTNTNATLEVMARMTDTKIDIKEIVSTWLLITYDLPHTEAGDKARREFLDQSKALGATHHTDSVYLLPWTPVAEHIALELARTKGGKVVVWTSKTTDVAMAKTVTENYDKNLEPVIDEIDKRIDKIVDHLYHNRLKRAHKMLDKTESQIAKMEQAINRRGSMELTLYFQIVKKRFNSYSQI